MSDWEPCELWIEKERKARKTHKCDCCQGVIEPKTQYFTHFSVFQGDATSAKMCKFCFDDRSRYSDAYDQDLFCPTQMELELKECISQDDDPSVAAEILRNMELRAKANQND